MLHTLYICYFGLREPLVQTQVLPYLREIAKTDLKVYLLTFEADLRTQWTPSQIESEKQTLAGENIIWHHLAYHKRPSAPATLFDVLNGARFAINLARREKIDVFHARAHVAVWIALLASKITKSRIIFDIRGLMAEEYADAGVWAENSKPFNFVKRIERKAIDKAAQIVVLTNRMRDHLIENNLKKSENIEVIPCCVDFSRIERIGNIEKSRRFEMIYAGSVTGLYLLREMGIFFLEIKKHKPDAFFQILTAAAPETVRQVFQELNIIEEDFAVVKALPEDVPKYLKRAHLGISFRKPTFSQIAASPTKIPEYLACGLPIVSNYGIGDTDLLLETEKVGVCLKNFDQSEIVKSAESIIKLLEENEIAEKCIRAAHKNFDLIAIGGENYRDVYRRLAADKC